MDVIDLLACDNYLIVNRDLMKLLGVAEAMLIGELASEHRYWKKAGKLVDGEWFFSTNENLEERIPFSRPTIKKAADRLENLGIIESRLAGTPAKKHYRINALQLEKFFKQDCQKVYKLDCEDFSTKNNKEEYENNNPDEKDVDAIPLAAITTPFVEITIYDSDDNNNCIAVKHQVSPRDWNKAVRKWRKDESTSVMLELKDTGESERMTFNRIKKFDVRPKIGGSVNQYNGGTAFQG